MSVDPFQRKCQFVGPASGVLEFFLQRSWLSMFVIGNTYKRNWPRTIILTDCNRHGLSAATGTGIRMLPRVISNSLVGLVGRIDPLYGWSNKPHHGEDIM